jgi:NADH-quinone oxidoreductase subunit M
MLSLYKKSFFGPVTKEENRKLSDLNGRELTALVPLVAIIIWLGVYPKPVLKPIDSSVRVIVNLMKERAQEPQTKSVVHLTRSIKEAK